MPKPLDSTGILFAVLMAAAWALLIADLYVISTEGMPMSGEGRYSRGWEMLWAFVLAFVAWVFLLLILSRMQPPGWWWVYLTGAAATVGLFALMDEGKTLWPVPVIPLLPALFFGAAITARWMTFRTPLLVVAGIPLLIAIGTFGYSAIQNTSAESLRQAEVRRQNLKLVATIDEQHPLWSYLPLLKEEAGVRTETLAALRKLNRRQADAEAMLANESFEILELMPDLDLQPTPRLQQLLNAYCAKTAEYARTKPGGSTEILERDFMWTALPALQWMHSKGGDCREGATLLKSAALEYDDTKTRAKYIRELDKLLK